MEIQPVCKENDDAEVRTSTDFIEHHVSKLDTLPGIAIKYGVEVADIKRINGITSDFQIYALGVLQIPLPGRHRPSDTLPPTSKSHKHRRSEPRPRSGKPLFPFTQGVKSKSRVSTVADLDGRHIEKTKVTPAMDLLQGYYGLTASQMSNPYDTDTLHTPDTDAQSEEEPFTPPSVSQSCNNRQPFSLHGGSIPKPSRIGHQEKNKQADKVILGNGSSSGIDKVSAAANEFGGSHINRSSDNKVVVRRRAKVDGSDNNEAAVWQDSGQQDSTMASGKAPLPKPPKISRSGSESESDNNNNISAIRLLSFSSPFTWTSSGGNPAMDRGNVVEDLISKIRKSASTSNLPDERKVSQAVNLVEVGDQSRSITFLEGLAKPSNRRNKAALD